MFFFDIGNFFFAEGGANNKVANDGLAHGANDIDTIAPTTVDAKKKEEAAEGGHGKKERSVLQTKLTRLAIQIGYGGNEILTAEKKFIVKLLYCNYIVIILYC